MDSQKSISEVQKSSCSLRRACWCAAAFDRVAQVVNFSGSRTRHQRAIADHIKFCRKAR